MNEFLEIERKLNTISKLYKYPVFLRFWDKNSWQLLNNYHGLANHNEVWLSSENFKSLDEVIEFLKGEK